MGGPIEALGDFATKQLRVRSVFRDPRIVAPLKHSAANRNVCAAAIQPPPAIASAHP